jgi:hypothetical protein
MSNFQEESSLRAMKNMAQKKAHQQGWAYKRNAGPGVAVKTVG